MSETALLKTVPGGDVWPDLAGTWLDPAECRSAAVTVCDQVRLRTRGETKRAEQARELLQMCGLLPVSVAGNAVTAETA